MRRDAHIRFLKLQVEMLKERLPVIPAQFDAGLGWAACSATTTAGRRDCPEKRWWNDILDHTRSWTASGLPKNYYWQAV